MENTIVTQLSNARTAAQARLAEIMKECEELKKALGETSESVRKAPRAKRVANQKAKATKTKGSVSAAVWTFEGNNAGAAAALKPRTPRTLKTDATIPAPPPRKSRAPKVSDGKCEEWILSELKREASKVGPLCEAAPFPKSEVNRTLKALRTAGKIEMQGAKRGAVYSLVSEEAQTSKAAE